MATPIPKVSGYQPGKFQREVFFNSDGTLAETLRIGDGGAIETSEGGSLTDPEAIGAIPASEKGATGGVALADLSNDDAAEALRSNDRGTYVVGSRASHYAGNATYASLRAGTTRSRHLIPVDADSLTLVFAGFYNLIVGTGADGERPSLANLEIGAVIEGPAIATGTATGGSGTTLVDSGGAYVADQYVGWFVRNNATGNIAKITTNNGTTFTVTPAPTWTISAGQSYSIIRAVLVRFDRARLALVKPATILFSDPAFLHVPGGSEIWVRTFANRLASSSYTIAGETGLLGSAQSYWPSNRVVRGVAGGNGEGVVYTTSDGVDPSTVYYGEGGAIPATDISGYSPIAILAHGKRGTCKGVAVVGDSIFTPGYDSYESLASGFGIVHRALYGERGIVNLACGGEQAWHWINGNATFRRQLAALCDTAIVDFGSNDLHNNGANAATLQSRLTTLWGSLAALGLKVYQCTILPRTTSTDGFETTGNQTVSSAYTFEASRVTVNDWIRTTPSPLSGYFETADAVETARNSGIWIAPGTAASTGTATGGTSTTLVDSGASWTTNQWAGYSVRNTTTGANAYVLSNTATTLTVVGTATGTAWTSTSGDAYRIIANYTADGTHPNGLGNQVLADVIELP